MVKKVAIKQLCLKIKSRKILNLKEKLQWRYIVKKVILKMIKLAILALIFQLKDNTTQDPKHMIWKIVKNYNSKEIQETLS